MESIDTAAPAQPESVTPQAPFASPAAPTKDEGFAKFREARNTERAKTQPDISGVKAPETAPKDEKTPVAAAPAVVEPPKTISKRQERINQYERELATLREENARLKTAPAKPEASAPKVVAKSAESDPEPDPSDATKYPDGQYDLKFHKDLASWHARQAVQTYEKQQADARSKEAAARTRADAQRTHDEQAKTFIERVNTAVAADATLLESIDPKLFELEPSIALQPGTPMTFGNAVADVLIQSSHPVALMRHLSDANEVQRLAALSPDAFYREIGRIEAGFSKPASPAPTPQLTNAPRPVPTVGERPASPSDPAKAAVATNNFAAYRKAKLAERIALHR